MAIEKIEPVAISVDENGDPVLDEKGLKSTWVKKTKKTAHSLLTPTDCYEYGTDIYTAYFGGYLIG